jgi:DNA-binding protein HU-beta
MALKRKNKVEAGFAMASMTDIIFLLLLFFVIASTLSSPNDIKIDLPQSKAKTSTPVIKSISEALISGDKVSLVGFGTFSVVERSARAGINPATKKPIKIPAKKVAKFKAGSELANAVK